MSLFESLALLGLLSSPVAAFWRMPCKAPIVVERMDPIVQPGGVSNHLHTIMGGNGFAPTMDYNSTQASTCSSCTVIGDNSNYWVPTMWYAAQDGTFESVDQVGGVTAYYLQRGGNGEKIKAFPPGFRMISGDPFKRQPGSDFASQAISYNCLGTSNPETGNFPNYNCPSGLRAQVFFPSCWNGKDLDAPDHKSHMSFPTGSYNGGSCPPDFPIHLVSLFFEVIWDTNKFKDRWYGNSQPFVFSQGDPTGYGGHGDFVMGWEESHLQRAVDTCTNDSGRVEDCAEFKLIPDSQAAGCSVAPVVNEVVSGKLSALPGCNPIQPGPDRAQIKTDCSATTSLSQSNQTGFADLTSQGWAYAGCGTDNYYNRILTGASTSQASMTNDQCVQLCSSKGFTVAGTEYSKECYCGNSIPDAGAPIPGVPGNCKMPCAGDATQMCGGSGPISLYTKCTGSSCTNANVGGPVGQVISTPSTPSTPSTGSSSSGSVSSSSSSSAGPVYSAPSPSTVSGSTGSGSSDSGTSGSGSGSSDIGSGSGSSSPSSVVVSPSMPSSPSNGGSSESGSGSSSGSGSGSGSSMPSMSSGTAPSASSSLPTMVPTTTATPPGNASVPVGWTYSGCFVDTVFPRSLPTWSNFNGPKMTNSACATFCDNKGFMLAGTEYTGQCFCGNGLVGSAQADEAECSTKCSGNAGETCGGPARLSVYKKSAGSSSMVRRHLARHERRVGRSGHA